MRRIFLTLLLLLTVALPYCEAAGKRVLYIGDSITDGCWGNNKKWNAGCEERNQRDMNHIYGHGYMEQCAAYYQGEYPDAGFVFWNRGISGNTLADLEQRWGQDVMAHRPDIVSILIGTNDAETMLRGENGSAAEMADWEKRYRHLLDSTLHELPNVQFVLCTPFIGTVGNKESFKTTYTNRKAIIDQMIVIVNRIAKDYGAVLVPFDQLIDQLLQRPEEPTYWVWDGIHPTPAAHYLMGKLWREACAELMTGD